MFRKNNLLIITLFSVGLLLLTACDSEEDILDSANPDLVESNVEEDVKKAKELNVSDIEEYIVNNIQLSLGDIGGLNFDKVHVTEDKLRLLPDSYKKPISNMDVDIYIDIDQNGEEIDKEEIVRTFQTSFLDNLRENKDNIELMRLGFVNIIYNNDLDNELNDSMAFTETNEYIKDYNFEENPDLTNLNKKAYMSLDSDLTSINDKLKKTNNESMDQIEYSITGMGFIDSTFLVESKIFFYNGEEEEYIDDLKRISKDVFNSLKEDEEIIQILNGENIDNIKFEYHAKWFRYGESLIYNYEI